jgi:beta-lactamase regulating signal transducer with metallopeptidase domain
MTLPFVELFAQAAVARILNSLPEGIALVVLAWAVLRVLPRQNSRTRFAVWFLALVAVISLPFISYFLDSSVRGSAVALPRIALALPSHWATFLFGAWLVVASIALLRVIVGVSRLWSLRRSCTIVDPGELDPLLRSTIQELSAGTSFMNRPVAIATSEQIRVPAALGLWKPMIVLPAWTLKEVASEDLSIVLRHEFAHLRRWDDWTNLLQKIARALFFFHPAVWWIENRLSVEREMACDDAVVAEIANASQYANCLVSLLEKSMAQRGWTMAQALVHRAREASLRLAQILDRKRPRATHVSKPVIGFAGAMAAICVMAAPYAPEFVTFDRGSAAVHTEVAKATVDSGVDTRFSPRAASTALRETTALPSKTRTRNMRAVVRDVTPHAAKSSAASPATLAAIPNLAILPWLDVSGVADSQELIPQTLVFVQSTQVVSPDSEVIWSVRVWRITVIKPDTKHVVIVPVPRTT